MTTTYGRYKVTGRRQYRGHEPGAVFEALIAPTVEHRAVARGDIVLLERITPSLTPGSFTLRAWPPPDTDSSIDRVSTEAAEAASLMQQGG